MAPRERPTPGPPGPPGAGGAPLRSTSSTQALCIEHMAEKVVQGRAVLVDLHAHSAVEH